MLGLIFDEADVDGIVQHPALDEGGIVDLRFRPHLRELLLEAVQQLRQDVGADGDAGADAQGTDAVPVFDAGLHLVKEGRDVQGVTVEFPPGFGGQNPPSPPLEEPHTVIFLQFLHRQAHRRLGQMQLLRCPGDIAVLKDGHVDFHMSQCHGFRSFIINSL